MSLGQGWANILIGGATMGSAIAPPSEATFILSPTKHVEAGKKKSVSYCRCKLETVG